MNKKKIYIFFLILFFIASCSFDDKTGFTFDDKEVNVPSEIISDAPSGHMGSPKDPHFL